MVQFLREADGTTEEEQQKNRVRVLEEALEAVPHNLSAWFSYQLVRQFISSRLKDETVEGLSHKLAVQQNLALLQQYIPLSALDVGQATMSLQAYIRQVTDFGDQSPTAQALRQGSSQGVSRASNLMRVLYGDFEAFDQGPSVFCLEPQCIYASAHISLTMPQILAQIWALIERPELWAQQQQDARSIDQEKDLARHALMMRLAAGIETDGRRICANGLAQQVMTVVMALLPGYTHPQPKSAEQIFTEALQNYSEAIGDGPGDPHKLENMYYACVTDMVQSCDLQDAVRVERDHVQQWFADFAEGLWEPPQPQSCVSG